MPMDVAALLGLAGQAFGGGKMDLPSILSAFKGGLGPQGAEAAASALPAGVSEAVPQLEPRGGALAPLALTPVSQLTNPAQQVPQMGMGAPQAGPLGAPQMQQALPSTLANFLGGPLQTWPKYPPTRPGAGR